MRQSRPIDFKLPGDVMRYAVWQFLKQLLICLGTWGFVVLVYVVYRDYFFTHMGKPGTFIAFAAFLILPVALTRICRFMTDRSWVGEIVDVTVENVSQPIERQWHYRMANMNAVKVSVRLADGQIKEIVPHIVRLNDYVGGMGSIPEWNEKAESGKAEYLLDQYPIGGKIYHFWGIKRFWVEPDVKAERNACVVCGFFNPKDAARCQECKHTLIKKP